MIIKFRPSLDEHIEFLTERQEQLRSQASNKITWVFFSFNLGFVPAVMIFDDRIWLALSIFAFNLLLIIFLFSWQQKNFLRKYYKQVWPHLEDHDCQVTIDEKGVKCEHAGNLNFYPWTNVRSIGETDRVIYFDVRPTQLLVSKRAFSREEEARTFIESASELKFAVSSLQT